MTRLARFALLALAIGIGCGSETPETPSTPAPAKRTRPNLLVITLDTVRADSLGSYGQPRVVTPHIDAFADQGVLFENCVSSSPSTLASHASIFTGRHPFAHGVRSNSGYVLGESETTLAEALRSHGYRTRAEIASEVMVRSTRIDQGFESFHGVDAGDVELQKIRISDGDQLLRKSLLMARAAGDVTRHGIRFLEATEAFDDPFFLWLHYYDPHRPHVPPPRFKARFPDDPYLAEIAYTDDSIGDLLAALIRLDLMDDTLIVITSDHGEGLGEHGEHTHAYFLYDSTIRVPLIIRGPGVDVGRRVSSLVRTVDIAPTVLDLLELPPLPAPQGVSLRSVMNATDTPSLTGYGESVELLKAFGSPVLRFAREGRWKYIHTSPPELYDVETDPAELDNAAAREPERVAQLRAVLTDLVTDPTASAPANSTTEVDAADQARLEALGYLAGPAPAPDALASLALDAPSDGYSPAADVLKLNIANGFANDGFHDQAIEAYRELRTRHPRSAELLRRLVKSLYRLKDAEATSQREVAALLDAAVELDAENVEAFVQLAELSALAGSLDEAVSALRRILELEPCAGSARGTLINLLLNAERYRDRFEVAREGVLKCPELPSALNDMAWVFATSRDESLRDGAQAIDLAERALAIEPGRPGYRDTLAAAHAEAGNYPRAVTIIAEIIPDLERVNAPPEAIALFEEHMAEFEAGRPLRE